MAKRQIRMKPLSQDDPDEVWAPEAAKAGLSISDLRAQVRLADEILEELFKEEFKSTNPGS